MSASHRTSTESTFDLDSLTIEEAFDLFNQGSFVMAVQFWAFSNFTVLVPREEIRAYLCDKLGWVARHYFEVPKAVLQRYMASDTGRPQCSATTRKGTQCSHLVAGAPGYSLDAFLSHEGGFCRLHGGEAS